MKKVEFQCPECAVTFHKEQKEVNRWAKRGRTEFFCSLRCAGKRYVVNLPSEWRNSDGNKDHLRNISTIAAEVNRKFKSEDAPFYEYYRRARKRKHECTMRPSDLREIWEAQGGRCALTNIPLVHPTSRKTEDINTLGSLDRIDSSKGYVLGNVQFVSCAINLAKRDRSDDSVRTLIRLILENVTKN